MKERRTQIVTTLTSQLNKSSARAQGQLILAKAAERKDRLVALMVDLTV